MPIENKDSSQKNALLSPLIVLVRPQMGENIGAAARAMLNFGVTGMRLVNPRDGWPNERATATAAGASKVLDHVQVYDSVAEAIADCHFVVATTIRQRGVFLPVMAPTEAAETLFVRSCNVQRTAILFGAENAGLDTDELAHADAILSIPVNPDFSSLNLSQAVMVIAYEWSRQQKLTPLFQSPYDETPATKEALEGMVQHTFRALDKAGYFYPPDKRTTLERNIRTLLSHARFSEPEVHLFRGMMRQFMRGSTDE